MHSVLLPFSVSFLLPLEFKRYGLASVFFITCNMYVRPGYVYRRDSDKTYASCWLARVAVDLLVLRCLLKAYSDYTKQVVIYGVPSWTIIDPCTSLVDPRESIRLSIIKSIIGSILDHRIDLRKSIIDNRIDSRGSTSDAQGSIIVHPRRRSISNRAIIAKIPAGGIKATG